MITLKNKKAFVYGETNDIFDTILAELLTAAGTEVISSATDCFSWGTGESVSVAEQTLAKQTAEQYGAENMLIVVGFTSVFTLGKERIGSTIIETFLNGDPAEAGPLAGVALGIKTYSIFEFENEIPEETWKKCGMNRAKRRIGKEEIKKFINRLKELRGD